MRASSGILNYKGITSIAGKVLRLYRKYRTYNFAQGQEKYV